MPWRLPALAALLACATPAQEPKAPPAYPQRDILSPFRNPEEICAPPDALFAQLRRMRNVANDPNVIRTFDEHGREVIEDEQWRTARAEVERLGIDAGYLAQIVRTSRNADERDLAFLGAFYCVSVDAIFNLISHIPGEPVRKTREQAMPRAIAFVRTWIGRRFGDLTPEQQKEVLERLPKPGSPAAKAAKITRGPEAGDALHHLNLKPFFQLLDLDVAADQAQGLWFLKECFLARIDLAEQWLEPALPRVRQLLLSDNVDVRTQAIGLLAAIAPRDLATPAPDAGNATLIAFADAAERRLFPPIRHLGAGLVLLFPSPERQAIAEAGRRALEGGTLGSATSGRLRDGGTYRGFAVRTVPRDLADLRMPDGAVITAVNGTPVRDAEQLLELLEDMFVVGSGAAQRTVSRRSLLVEFVLDGEPRAIEYRVM